MPIVSGSAGPISASAFAPTCAAPTTGAVATRAPTPATFCISWLTTSTLRSTSKAPAFFTSRATTTGTAVPGTTRSTAWITSCRSPARPIRLKPSTELDFLARAAVSRAAGLDLVEDQGSRSDVGADRRSKSRFAWPIRAPTTAPAITSIISLCPGTTLSRPMPAWDARRRPTRMCRSCSIAAGTRPGAAGGSREFASSTGHLDCPQSRRDVAIGRSLREPAMLRALEFSVPRERGDRPLVAARLRVTWDDRPASSIDAPVALFYGAGTLYNRDDREYLVKAFSSPYPLTTVTACIWPATSRCRFSGRPGSSCVGTRGRRSPVCALESRHAPAR